MEKSLYFALLSTIIILIFLIFYGKNGFIDLNRLRLQEQAIISENEAIDEANKVLERRVARLKGDISYIEHIARHELGMVAKDELVFRLKDIKKDTK
ncbi:MAG: septum formation initiator family protein [Desulfamplus sp.]|nr:septum formation initiator family protein [Desulfamplus sp.]MBF0210128.1 septum formation initiator family protein [Desulfamplus sp.]MBF0243414.1 septum formation initiator family protein [Desulfamplus sp.]MBF0388876.1 septum formation initiator family protein [Desulfamplus sp.]